MSIGIAASATMETNGPPLLQCLATATAAVRELVDKMGAATRALVVAGGTVAADRLEQHQTEAHGYAWMASYCAILESAVAWADQLEARGAFGAIEQLLLTVGAAEYVQQICHGIAMSQDEIVRPSMFGLQDAAAELLRTPDIQDLLRAGATSVARTRLVSLLRQGGLHTLTATADAGEAVAMVRDTFRAFADEQVVPHAPGCHDRDELMPLSLIDQLAALGVFGLTTPEQLGGSGLGTVAMCVVTEELSRGYIGVGSLGTRA